MDDDKLEDLAPKEMNQARLMRLMMLIDDKVDDIWHALYKKREPWPSPKRVLRHRPEE